MEPFDSPDAMLEELAAGRRLVYWSGQVVPYRLSAGDRERFERAKRVGFLIAHRRPNAELCYRRWCEIHFNPIVTIRRGPRHADDFLEMSCANWKLDREAIRDIDVHRYLWALDTPGCHRQSHGLDDDCLVNFDMIRRVSHGDAEMVAFRLWEIAMDCRPMACAI